GGGHDIEGGQHDAPGRAAAAGHGGPGAEEHGCHAAGQGRAGAAGAARRAAGGDGGSEGPAAVPGLSGPPPGGVYPGQGEALMRRLSVLAMAGLVVVLVAGCASPPSKFYTLSAIPGPAAPASEISVSVGPVTIPASVDRPQMVVTAGVNQVRLEEFNRWASPLQNNIARVVAENLVAMLGTP